MEFAVGPHDEAACIDNTRVTKRRSTAAQDGWWNTEHLKIYEVVMQEQFWIGLWQHVAFPAVWLLHRRDVLSKLKRLQSKPSTRKMANDITMKARGFLVSHLVFSLSFVVWQLGTFYLYHGGWVYMYICM